MRCSFPSALFLHFWASVLHLWFYTQTQYREICLQFFKVSLKFDLDCLQTLPLLFSQPLLQALRIAVCLIVTSKLFRDWVWLQVFCNKARFYSMPSHNMAWKMSFLAIPLYSVSSWTGPEYWHLKGNPGSVPLSFHRGAGRWLELGNQLKYVDTH